MISEAAARSAPRLRAVDGDAAVTRLWWAALLGVCVLLLVPLLLVDVPPLVDYPDHLAQLYVLAFPDDAALSRIYAQHWPTTPNLVIDVLAPPLLRVLPVYVAGRLVVAVALLLPVLGCAAYGRAAFGRLSFWPLASALMAYNALFLLGFLNFQIAVGLALFCGAGWCVWSGRYPMAAAIAGAVCAVTLFFCHIFGVVLFAALIVAREAALAWRVRQARDVSARAAMLAAVFAIPTLLFALATLRDPSDAAAYVPITRKLLHLLSPFADYDQRVALVTAVGTLAVVAWLALARSLRTAPGTLLAVVVLLPLYAVLPDISRGSAFIDARIPILLGLLLFAGVAPMHLSRRGTAIATCVLTGLLLLHVGSVAETWDGHARELAEMRATIAPVEPGAKVLVATADPLPGTAPAGGAHKDRSLPGYIALDTHMAALLVLEHRAFWPQLFAAPAPDATTVLPPYGRLALPQVRLPDYRELSGAPTAEDLAATPYLANWQRDFDYVLLLDADAAGDLSGFAPDRLQLLHQTEMAALFRVKRPAP